MSCVRRWQASATLARRGTAGSVAAFAGLLIWIKALALAMVRLIQISFLAFLMPFIGLLVFPIWLTYALQKCSKSPAICLSNAQSYIQGGGGFLLLSWSEEFVSGCNINVLGEDEWNIHQCILDSATREIPHRVKNLVEKLSKNKNASVEDSPRQVPIQVYYLILP